MYKVPKFTSNKKYWLLINRLVFGTDVICPQCSIALQENYRQKYLWCHMCRRKYRATAYRGGWLYGMKISTKQLFILLWCWQHKKSLEASCQATNIINN